LNFQFGTKIFYFARLRAGKAAPSGQQEDRHPACHGSEAANAGETPTLRQHDVMRLALSA